VIVPEIVGMDAPARVVAPVPPKAVGIGSVTAPNCPAEFVLTKLALNGIATPLTLLALMLPVPEKENVPPEPINKVFVFVPL
jgi:hypothetical protein